MQCGHRKYPHLYHERLSEIPKGMEFYEKTTFLRYEMGEVREGNECFLHNEVSFTTSTLIQNNNHKGNLCRIALQQEMKWLHSRKEIHLNMETVFTLFLGEICFLVTNVCLVVSIFLRCLSSNAKTSGCVFPTIWAHLSSASSAPSQARNRLLIVLASTLEKYKKNHYF